MPSSRDEHGSYSSGRLSRDIQRGRKTHSQHSNYSLRQSGWEQVMPKCARLGKSASFTIARGFAPRSRSSTRVVHSENRPSVSESLGGGRHRYQFSQRAPSVTYTQAAVDCHWQTVIKVGERK